MGKWILPAAALLLFTMTPAADTVVVDDVHPDSAAEAAGLLVGDHLLRMAGREIEGFDALKAIMSDHQPGDTVPLLIRRGDKTLELSLTFGKHPSRGASLGVALAVGVGTALGEGEDTREARCFEWIEKTYRIEPLMKELDLDLEASYEKARACVGYDARRVPSDKVIAYCDNIFKIHCSGVDLLAEIGDGLVQRCETQLNASLGVKLDEYKGWQTCAQHRVFDRYAGKGELSDEAACRADLLDACGTKIGEPDSLSKRAPAN